MTISGDQSVAINYWKPILLEALLIIYNPSFQEEIDCRDSEKNNMSSQSHTMVVLKIPRIYSTSLNNETMGHILPEHYTISYILPMHSK